MNFETKLSSSLFNLQLFADDSAPDNKDTSSEASLEVDFSDNSRDTQLELIKKWRELEETPDEEDKTPPVNDEKEDEAEADEEETDETEDETVDEEDEEQSEEDQATFEIKVGGEVKKVSQDELVKLAQQGLDYTNKTQQLAAQRKALEQMVLAQQQKPTPPANPLETAAKELADFKEMFQKETGVEFNDYDLVHQRIFFDHTQKIASQKQSQVALRNHAQSLINQCAADPMAEDINNNFDEQMFRLVNNGPEGVKKFQQVFEAKSRLNAGTYTAQDLDVLKEQWDSTKQALTAKQAPKKAKVTKQKATPPKIEKSGSADVSNNTKPTFDRDAWTSGDTNSKIAMLRKLRETGQI